MASKYLVQGPILKEPIPYIQGFGLTYPQLDAVVSSVLSLQVINSYGGNILTAIRAELREAGQDFTIVPFATGPKDNRHVRYLYIIDVLPSWNGERPRIPISQKMANTFFETFGRDEWLEELKPYCIRWPSYEPEPKWLRIRLWKSVKKLGDWVKRRMTSEEIDAAMQQPEVETEEELMALKLKSSQSSDMDVISFTTPSQSTSLGSNTTSTTRDEKSNAVARAITPSRADAPPPEPIPSQSSPMETDIIVTTTRRKRKVSPPEPMQPMTRPKRVCTMKK